MVGRRLAESNRASHPGARRRRAVRAAILIAIALGVGHTTLRAHELARGVGTQSVFSLRDDAVEIELNFGVSKLVAYSYMSQIDSDGSERVTPEEADAFLTAKGKELVADLELYLNDQRIPLAIERHWENGLRGPTGAYVFDCYFKLVAKLPPALPDGGWWLHYHDGTFANETSSQFCWVRDKEESRQISYQILVPEPESVPGSGYRTEGRNISIFFDRGDANPRFFELMGDRDKIKRETMQEFAALREKHRGGAAAKNGDAEVASTPAAPIFEEREDTGERSREGEDDSAIEWAAGFLRDIAKGRTSMLELLLGIILAIGYGAGHALAPGHGKAMVSAYLVGTKGRIRDAIVLGTVVTFAHTFTIFLFGIFLLYLMQQITEKAGTDTYQNMMISTMSFVSGLLLAVLGGVLTRHRWRHRNASDENHDHHHGLFGHSHPHLPAYAHSHSHAHGHDHEHAHGHGGEHEHVHEHEHGHAHVHASAVATDSPAASKQGTRFRDLLVLGLSGGMVPCPTGFAIMIFAAQFQAMVAGIVLFFFFSVGLGAVLVGIGILLVTGRDWLLRASKATKERRDWWIRRISIASASLILALGIYFMVESVAKDPKSFALLFHTIGRWLEGGL